MSGNLRHRTEYKMGTQGFNTDKRDETMNSTEFPNYVQDRIYINSDDKVSSTYQDAEFFSENSIVKRGVSAIGVERIDLAWCIPNVNSHNNIISFHQDGGPVLTVALEIGNYTKTTDLYDEITAKMNSVVVGEPFGYDLPADCAVALTHAGGTFQFDNCLFINNGRSLTGLFYTDLVEDIESVPYLLYTDYIDIVVEDILNGQIAQSSYSKQQLFNTTQHLARVNVGEVAFLDLPRHITVNYIKINYIPYRHRTLKDLRVKIYDSNNLLIWAQSFTDSTLTTHELCALKYNIVLNTVF